MDLSQFDLDQIRQYIELALAEWDILVKDVPTEELPKQVYVIGSGIALFLWLFVARVLPSPLGRITWLFTFSVLCSPTVNSTGDVPQLVPASVGFVYGALTKNTPVMLTNATIILAVFGVLLFLAFIWERIKAIYIDNMIIEQNAKIKEYQTQLAMAGASTQLADATAEEIPETLSNADNNDDLPILTEQTNASMPTVANTHTPTSNANKKGKFQFLKKLTEKKPKQ